MQDLNLPSTYDGPIDIGIIGGTGLTHLPTLQPLALLPKSHPALTTPWGPPSSPIRILRYTPPPPFAASTLSSSGVPSTSASNSTTNGSSSSVADGPAPLTVAFLARHGAHHELAPHEVPSRANAAALRRLGVRCVLAFSAVGSLIEEVRPRDFVVVDQAVDRTKGVRPWTFFEGGLVGHVAFADPFDNALRALIIRAVKDRNVLDGGANLHDSGTVVVMEGPQFSTRAESHHHRSLGGTVINMTTLPEAKLFREAELGYAVICMATDYDAWHGTHAAVSVDMVLSHLGANAVNARRVAEAVLAALGTEAARDVREGRAWKGESGAAGGITGPAGRSVEARTKLNWLFPGEF